MDYGPQAAPLAGSTPKNATSVLTGHTASVLVVRSNAAGTYCMSGSRDHTVRLWNPHRGTHVNTYRGHSGDVRGLAIAADNASFVSAGEDRHINVWDVATAATVRRFHGHVAAVNAVQFAAEESLLVSASYDATVAFWDLKARSSKPLQSVKVASDAVTAIAVTARPSVIAASTDGTVSTLDVRNGSLSVDQVHHPVTSVAAPSDGAYVAAACTDSCVRLLDRETGNVLAQYTGHKHASFQLECALLSSDSLVACGSEDGQVVMWDVVRKHKVAALAAHTGVVTSLCELGGEGPMRLLTGGADKAIKLWA